MHTLNFNKDEFKFLSDPDILKQKRIIQDKIFNLLEEVKTRLSIDLEPQILNKFPTGRISRGENYKGLPYHVLDYPALFNNKDILACRTMFLWGNFFSTTIHLQGQYLHSNKDILGQLGDSMKTANLFVSCGNTPWEYSYNKDNYKQFTSTSIEAALSKNFVKISQKIELESYAEIPQLASEFYSPILDQLKF